MILIFLDEACDKEVHYMANIFETLQSDGPSEALLFMRVEPKYDNHSTMCKLFDRSTCRHV
jgi:hypothetical protein